MLYKPVGTLDDDVMLLSVFIPRRSSGTVAIRTCVGRVDVRCPSDAFLFVGQCQRLYRVCVLRNNVGGLWKGLPESRRSKI